MPVERMVDRPIRIVVDKVVEKVEQCLSHTAVVVDVLVNDSDPAAA